MRPFNNKSKWITVMQVWKINIGEIVNVYAYKFNIKLNFILIIHKRAEFQSKEVNSELWRKNGYYVIALWPWSMTQGHRFQLGSSNCSKQLFSEERVKSVWRFNRHFVHKWTDRQTDRHTYTQTDKLKWKYNLSTISWRCNKRDHIRRKKMILIQTG